MAQVYDFIDTDRNNPKAQVSYTSEFPTVEYPTQDTYSVLGPLYLPKIYGKDLTAFELASSGSIAVTIKDVYSFDLDRIGDTVSFKTRNSDPLKLASGSNELAYINIDGSGASNLIDIVAGKTASITAGSNVAVAAGSNVTLTASGTAAVVALDGSASNVLVSADASVTTRAGLDVDTAAGSNVYISAAGSNTASVSLLGPTGTIEIVGMSNINATAGQDFAITAERLVFKGQEVLLGGSNGDVLLGSSNAYIRINDSNIDYYALNNMHFMNSNNTVYDNQNAFTLNTNTFTLSAGSNVDVSAAGDTSLTAPNLTVAIAGAAGVTASNLTIQLSNAFNFTYSNATVAGSNLTETIAGNVTESYGALTTSVTAGVSVSAGTSATYTAGTSTKLQGGTSAVLQASSDGSVSEARVTATPDWVRTSIGGSNIIEVNKESVTINGELRINGDINSITTYETTLMVYDKEVTLAAAGSNGIFMDGPPTNDGSGLVIAGLPGVNGVMVPDTADNKVLYEKSFRFHANTPEAMTKLVDDTLKPDQAFDLESYWELKGGDFRMTLQKTATDFVTFGWRIGKFNELELIKQWKTGTEPTKTKVVSKFGRILSAADGNPTIV